MAGILDREFAKFIKIGVDWYVRVLSSTVRDESPLTTLYDSVPVSGTKSTVLDVTELDNIAIVVNLSVGTTSTAICTPEASVDNVIWVPLLENTLSITPQATEALFRFNQVEFHFLRMSFDTVTSGGDTFTVKSTGKGIV